MERLTRRASAGNAFLTKVKDTEQEVESKYPDTLKAIMESWDKLADYEDAEEQGRLVVLPCKVGDTVYCLCWGKPETCDTRTCPVKIDDVAQCGMCDEGVFGAHEIPFEIGWYDELGKTVFLTRPEAEAALKRQSGEYRTAYDEAVEQCGSMCIGPCDDCDYAHREAEAALKEQEG